MTIYTTYFDKVMNEGLPANIVPVSISLWPDKRFKAMFSNALLGDTLGPTKTTLRAYQEDHDWAKYVRNFFAEVLDNRNPDDIYATLERISGGRDVALVCFEKWPTRCHRSLVEQWLRGAGYRTGGEL